MDFDRTAIENLLALADSLIARIEDEGLSVVTGCNKLKASIKAEERFLRKVLEDPGAHLNPNNAATSSNLDHLGGTMSIMEALCKAGRGCTAVMRRFRTEDKSDSVDVDIVTDGGATWIKVVARNAKGTFTAFRDCEETGFKTIVSVAQLWLSCADANPHNFVPPQVAFHFVKGVVSELAQALDEVGVLVCGRIVADLDGALHDPSSAGDSSFNCCALPPAVAFPPVTRLNLDVTTLVAYVSGLTNNEPGRDALGRCVRYKDAVLIQQSEWEKTTRVKPFLDHLFEGKELVCCETAYADFQKIVSTLGGPEERKRAEALYERLTVVPDDPSTRVSAPLSSPDAGFKIRPRSIVVFGTGDQLKIPTVTANVGFLRSAEHLDVSLVAITHQSRALSEAKELLLDKSGDLD